jgi:hypothetical protein
MICGVFPCCNEEPLMLEISETGHLGMFMKDVCPGCGTTVFHYLSSLMPYSVTEADFNECYEIDEDSKKLKVRDGHKMHEHYDRAE